MSLFGHHDTASEEEPIERHGLAAVAVNGPVPNKVRPNVLGRTEPGPTNERNMAPLANRPLRGKNWLMEILERVVTSSTPSSPLENDGEIGIGLGNIDDLPNPINGTRLERDMLDARIPQPVDDLCSLLGPGDTGSNAETLIQKTLFSHLLQQGELEPELTGIDVERVERDADTRRDLGLDLRYLGAEGGSIVVSTAGKFNMVSCIKDCADEACFDGCGSHPGDHDGGFAQESRERRVEMDHSIAARDIK